MPELVESLEPRRLMSVTAVPVHGARAHRLNVHTSQVQIEARVIESDLKDLRRLGIDFASTQATEVRQISAQLHPLTLVNRELLDTAQKAAADNRKLMLLKVNPVVSEDGRVVLAITNDYALVVHHPGDQFALNKLSSALDSLSATSASLDGALNQVPAAQQTIDGDLNAVAAQNGPTIEARVSAAIANIDVKAAAIKTDAELLQSHTDLLESAAEQAIQ